MILKLKKLLPNKLHWMIIIMLEVSANVLIKHCAFMLASISENPIKFAKGEMVYSF